MFVIDTMPPTHGIRSSKARSRAYVGKAILAALLMVPGGAAYAEKALWESPFQAGKLALVRDHLKDLPVSRCDRADPYAKCTFSARVDYDGDGRLDRARMVEGSGVSAIIVDFSGKRKRPPLTIASFKGAWNGSCFIERDRTDRTAVSFICPEASAAIFKMRGGKPAARWIGD